MQWRLLSCLVFLGAFLLFTLEPFVGRSLVSQFGGSIHVWLVSLMFFQAMLFLGYAYAHLVARRIGRWHLLVAALPLVLLPIGVQYGASDRFSIPDLMLVLLLNIGLPFTVLATTAVVVQSWIADSDCGQDREPYFLYGASNAGSLAGLILYPFIIEPLSGLQIQSTIWSALFFVYLFVLFLGWRTLRPTVRHARADRAERGSAAPVKRSNYLIWLLLSGLPSAYLLSVTNYIGAEVGSFPLVWVIPLALYLLSFVITFREGGGCPALMKSYLLEAVAIGMVLYILPSTSFVALAGHLAVFCGICLIAHGELYARRPAARYLTHFYLTISAGGWLGGVAISLVAPHVFTGYYDYPIVLALLALILVACHREALVRVYREARMASAAFRMLVMMPALALICLAVLSYQRHEQFRHRNFYGTYRVVDVPASDEIPVTTRQLFHGSTLHGAQLLDPDNQAEPISYYHKDGAINRALQSMASPRRIAVVGLGAGVIGALTTSQDQLTFYELDPDNERIARDWFTFLDQSPAPVSVVSGDGRLRLRQSQQTYDVLVLDAFTGDGIPTHLLTDEAFEEYFNRLSSEGILLLHISNRYYDLRPVVKAIANRHKLHAVMNVMQADRTDVAYKHNSQCVVVSRNESPLQPLIQQGWVQLGQQDGLPEIALWTDDYIDIISPLVNGLQQRYLHPRKFFNSETQRASNTKRKSQL